MRGIVKTFGGVHALKGVDLNIYPGEVHVILGENGAGKSTLMKILSGTYQPSDGRIFVDGTEYTHLTPVQATHLGIAIIYQELSVINELSALENLFVGRIPVRRRFGFGVVDWALMRREAAEILKKLAVTLNLDTPVRNLPIAHRQVIEIAKALMLNARVVVMDEPTSSLTTLEVRSLFKIVRQLRDAGTAVLFISHKFDEVRAIGDRFSVLKDGATTGTGMIADTTNDDLIRMMVGRAVKQYFRNEQPVDRRQAPVLKVSHVSSRDRRQVVDVSFEVYKGEIIGFAGLIGSGRTELMNCLFGTMARSSGRIELNGRDITPRGPVEAVKRAMAYITESRRQTGFMPNFSIENNIAVSRSVKISPLRGTWGLIRSREDHRLAEEQRKAMAVKCASVRQNITELSGGNQQKVLIGKWMCTQPDVFIFDEPTRGIDVGAKAEIYRIMRALSNSGKAIIMVSSELPEILAICDRVAVFKTGRIVQVLDGATATEEQILDLALIREETAK
ncbi:MAG: ATP-binding cassette domain-containing protein [Verrucomicrobia bacterium]|nr:ATP-binding cassette domain-containing protein [Verrucomicrobiota bacterium]